LKFPAEIQDKMRAKYVDHVVLKIKSPGCNLKTRVSQPCTLARGGECPGGK